MTDVNADSKGFEFLFLMFVVEILCSTKTSHQCDCNFCHDSSPTAQIGVGLDLPKKTMRKN